MEEKPDNKEDEYQYDAFICGECNSKDIDFGAEEPFCKDCGLVAKEWAVDLGKDNRVFADGSGADGERWGMPKSHLYHDGGLTTEMAPAIRDGSGQRLNSKQRQKYNRLRRQHQRTRIRDAKERNLVTALNELDRLGSQMSLPRPVRENAARIYKRAVEKKLVRGRSIEGVVAACIHASCRLNNMSRTLDEIGQHSRTGRKEIGRTYKRVMKDLGIRILPTPPAEYVPRFSSQLQLDAKTQALATRILEFEQVGALGTGRGPTGLAAAAVYLATRINGVTRTQREVAMSAGVTEVTIRNRYKEICLTLNISPDTPTAP
jgi:transcription initiation factor TFIIB|tara:strand:- start:6096 stop:7049 length:954 start_codon:yes stop_codon:yes gene_type:complete